MNYDKLAATARRLIAKTGRGVTLLQLSSEAVDPDKPWKGPGKPTVEKEKDIIATFVPASSGLGRDLVDEELLKRADQVALIAPTDEDLEAYTSIRDNNVEWKIEWMQVLKPAEQVLLYIAGMKR